MIAETQVPISNDVLSLTPTYATQAAEVTFALEKKIKPID